jgi:aspartate aminotransferase
MDSLQSQETSNPSSVSQYAALAALEGPQGCVDAMLAEFAKRREYVKGRLAELPNVTCPEMGGAFYAFFNIKAHLGRSYGGVAVNNSSDWCLQLLAQQGVALVMGSAFGAEGYARLSFATSMDVLKNGFDKIEAFLKS